MRSLRPWARGIAAFLLLGGAAGCAGTPRVERAELPEAMLAIVHRKESQALDRVDALADVERRGSSPREGIARLEDLDALYGGAPDLQRRLAQYTGRCSLLDPRTGETRPLEGAPAGARPLGWSPDRRQLLLAGRWRDEAQLFVWDRETGHVDIATSPPGEHPLGCLGPDGQLVAVRVEAADGALRARLVIRPRGRGAFERLTDGPWDIQPACSPGGRLVAFVSIDAQGSGGISVLDLERPEEPPRIVARGTDPVFAPDGQWLIYSGPTSRGRRLWRVRADGGGRTLLGAGTAEELDPAVSPDGRFVAFVVEKERRERLWVRRLDGTGDRLLLESGDGAAPAW